MIPHQLVGEVSWEHAHLDTNKWRSYYQIHELLEDKTNH